VIDSERLVTCKLGNIGSVKINRIDDKKLNLYFFEKNKEDPSKPDIPLNIVKELPDRFWQKDFFTSRTIGSLENIYKLENGASKDLYENLQKDLNGMNGIPSLNETITGISNNITINTIHGKEIEVNPNTQELRCLESHEIPEKIKPFINKLEHELMSRYDQDDQHIKSSENTQLNKQKPEKHDVQDVQVNPLSNHTCEKIEEKKCLYICYVYRLRCRNNLDMWDKLPKSLYLSTEVKDTDEIYLISLDMNTFFEYNPRTKRMEKSLEKVSDYIMRQLNIITLADSNEVYWYDGGRYRENGDKRIREFCNVLFKDATPRFKEDVIKTIMDKTYIGRNKLMNKSLICLENGILNMNTLEVFDHNPKYYQINKLPVKYDPDADCPAIKQFLKEVLYEEDIQCVKEFVGFCLLREYKFHKAFMFYGEGANGKSTLINLITAFLGKKNISSESLHDLLNDRFAKANLYGKLANLFADIPSNALMQTGVFKTLTGEDMISAQKKFCHSFTFCNHAKLVFSANKLPETWDRTDAFFRRLIPINFPYRFEGDSADEDKIKKLTTPEELSGFLNFAMDGLRQLLANGKFSGSRGVEGIKKQYTRMSDSMRAFCDEMLKLNPAGRIVKKELYMAYCDYCREKKLVMITDNTFGKKLPMVFSGIRDGRPLIGDKREHCWFGISLKGSEKEDDTDE
jgi:putative DNA primase/helicase